MNALCADPIGYTVNDDGTATPLFLDGLDAFIDDMNALARVAKKRGGILYLRIVKRRATWGRAPGARASKKSVKNAQSATAKNAEPDPSSRRVDLFDLIARGIIDPAHLAIAEHALDADSTASAITYYPRPKQEAGR
jgi:hypothetical protein